MNPEELIDKYYAHQPKLKEILLRHSHDVAARALTIVDAHPELNANRTFVYEAAMLHDIGILYTNAPGIECFGSEHYLCHGILGAQLLCNEGLPFHARVAERHTGTGLTAKVIHQRNLPLPEQDFLPETWEEQIICYADKFYSKSCLDKSKTLEQVLSSLSRFGVDEMNRFREWNALFE